MNIQNALTVSRRVRNCLRWPSIYRESAHGYMDISVETVADLAALTPRELLSIKGFGWKCLAECEEMCRSHGFTESNSLLLHLCTQHRLLAQIQREFRAQMFDLVRVN